MTGGTTVGVEVSEAAKRLRLAGATMAVAMVLAGSAGGARADDGIGGFFQQLFGGGGGGQPLPQPDEAPSSSPPLTVRMHKHRRPSGARLAKGQARPAAQDLKTVTIYTDKTLVRGDAVMTPAGIRIFNGSTSWPHAQQDFVALSASAKMAATVRKELTAIDIAARSDFRRD